MNWEGKEQVKILLVTNRFKEATEFKAQEIAAKLRKMNVDIAIDDGLADLFPGDVDVIIVLGGDGTILRAARKYGQFDIPVLGVNMGTVGFLSNIEVSELDNYLEKLIQQQFVVNERMMIEADIYQEKNLFRKVFCLNEVVVKSQYSRMVSFNVNIAGQKTGIYRGDGIIISTPTGSTAYSLSLGGPIADPDLEVFIITPIASYEINKRPLIVSADKVLTLTPEENNEAVVYMDGQVQIPFEQDYEIKVIKANARLKLIDLKKMPFFSTVESRLRRNKGVL